MLRDEDVRKYKEIHDQKRPDKPITEAEAREQGERLVGLFRVLLEADREERQKKARLKAEPDGFPAECYTCPLCDQMVAPAQGWYDRWGVKCANCQRAVASGAVPGFAVGRHDSRYITWDLKSRFGIHHATAHKLVRQGKLVARPITNEAGRTVELVFLKKENMALAAADPHRKSPAEKSWMRSRDKTSKRLAREWREKENRKTKTSRFGGRGAGAS